MIVHFISSLYLVGISYAQKNLFASNNATCEETTKISSNQEVSGALDQNDCFHENSGVFVDVYEITLSKQEILTIKMQSNDFTPLLILASQTEKITDATGAQITEELSAGNYLILATSTVQNQIGSYTITTKTNTNTEQYTKAIMFSNIPPLDKILINQLNDVKRNGKRFKGTATLYLNNGDQIQLKVKQKTKNNSISRYILKTNKGFVPKFKFSTVHFLMVN